MTAVVHVNGAPAALIDGAACALLSHPLGKMIEKALEAGQQPDLSVILALRAVRAAADAFVRQGSRPSFPVSPSAFLDDEMSYISTEEAAKLLGCTSRTVRNYVRTGKLVGHKVQGKLRVSAQAVEAEK